MIRYTWFFLIYFNEAIVLQASFNSKNLVTRVTVGQQNLIRSGKLLSEEGLFPIEMVHEEHGWKLIVGIDLKNLTFTLTVDSTPFPLLPFQAAIPNESSQQAIEDGYIILNNNMVHRGHLPWSAEAFQKLRVNANGSQSTVSILFERIRCSSAVVLNQLVKEIGQSIAQDNLRQLRIKDFADYRHDLEPWLLETISAKATNCEALEISDLRITTEPNRSVLLEMAAQICTKSHCLTELVISQTFTTTEEGEQFLEALLCSRTKSLQTIEISGEFWFESSKCIQTLKKILAKQLSLQKFTMMYCCLSESQAQDIRNSIKTSKAPSALSCEVIIEEASMEDNY